MNVPFKFFQVEDVFTETMELVIAFRAPPNLAKQRVLVEATIPASSVHHFEDQDDLLELWEERAIRNEENPPGELFCIWTSRWAILSQEAGDVSGTPGLDEFFIDYLHKAHEIDPIAEAVSLLGVPMQWPEDTDRSGWPRPVPVFKPWVCETPWGNLFDSGGQSVEHK